jgi:putative sterol carrier protein
MADPKTDFETLIPGKITRNPDKARAVGAIYLFRITGEQGGTWTVNLKDDVGVSPGEVGKADCVIEINESDWQTISANPATAMQLYFQGKLKVSGNVMLATRLQQILG